MNELFAKSLAAFSLSSLGLLLSLALVPFRWQEDPYSLVFGLLFVALTLLSLSSCAGTYRNRTR